MNRAILLIIVVCLTFTSSNFANEFLVLSTEHNTAIAKKDYSDHTAVDQNSKAIQDPAIEVTIKEIVTNPERFENKAIIVSGVCTKINLEIMGRNWIHLNDGTKDDFDFVITSEAKVKRGEQITMRGVLRLNVDFGFGYKYELIMQEAEIVE